MPQVLNNEVDILNVANIDNDIRDSYTRAMIAGEEKETYCTRQGGYDINEFFIWTDRQIYKTKAVIAQGDTFILNTNIVLAGTLSDQMYQLFAQSPESIREVISNIEEGSTATKNYHAGEYFIWNDGFLYKVTAATINIGTAFVVDTNVVKCNNVTDELSSLNEALTNTKDSVTSIDITGSTNNTGSTIASKTFFYLNGALVRAKTNIANGATLTLNTNYEVVPDGGLNALETDLTTSYYKTSGYSAGDLNAQKTNSLGLQQFDHVISPDIGVIGNSARGAIINCGTVEAEGTWAAQIAILPYSIWLRTKWNSTTWGDWVNVNANLDTCDILYDKAYDSSGVLRHAYTDYKYIIVVARANNVKATQIVPVESLETADLIMLKLDTWNTEGQISDYTYKASVSVKFTSATTFEEHAAYNNVNYKAICRLIYGVNKPIAP